MRCICIHAHFYQPPRENPWLDYVPLDPTAAPAHDWNTRINNECYRPNRSARLISNSGKITYIINNYKHLNFNIGPTLHHWINHKDPELASGILEADRTSAEELGAGAAIAQAYNHMIMPLANTIDKRTQTLWGIRDFEFRYGRHPIGMWLPETAVDLETLETLAQADIEYTILAPHQCAAVRAPNEAWQATQGGSVDPSRPYNLLLPSGRIITLIFYQGSVAHNIAFGGLLDSGERFAESLMNLVPESSEPKLITVATDGETYGHHHRYGEMALARAFQIINNSSRILCTNIASFLKSYPATWECKINENTSWSCAHGLERWRSDCGCHTGGKFGWNQQWRAPLREALDTLRDNIDELYEKHIRQITDSPWELRNQAIELYLLPHTENEPLKTLQHKKDFLKKLYGSISEEKQKQTLSLLEAQRMRQFMYTSCGWFFSDISGIETRQILSYALRASELMEHVTGVNISDAFLKNLEKVNGNTEADKSGRDVVEHYVIPDMEPMETLVAGAALREQNKRYYFYDINAETHAYPSGDFSLKISSLCATDSITGNVWSGSAAVFSTGGLDDICRLSQKNKPEDSEITHHFYASDILSFSRYLEKTFELGPWSYKDLPVDCKIYVSKAMADKVERNQTDIAQAIVEENRRLMVQLQMLGAQSPPILTAAAHLIIKIKIAALNKQSNHLLNLLDPNSHLERLLKEARELGTTTDLSIMGPRISKELNVLLADNFFIQDEYVYERVLRLLKRAQDLHIPIEKWNMQNEIWRILETKSGKPSGVIMELAKALDFAVPDSL